MSNIESHVNDLLNKSPYIKKVVKRVYQFAMYSISSKTKFEGDINRISPKDGMEYFFGYYDNSPWDISDRYMLCLRAKDTYKSVAPKEVADILLFDIMNGNSYEVLGHTKSWNVQQGCMLQWLGPDFSERIIYNDFRDGRYCSVISNIKTKEERVIEMPVYSVSKNGKFALSLDFSRLHRLRKGYGYSNIPELTANEKCPNKPCIWYIDLESGDIKPLMNYTNFAYFETRPEMKDAEHKVNHIMLNPSGNRFMVLHRWFKGSRKYTRLITINVDGTEMYNLSDDDMVSHCCWKNDEEILAYARKKQTGNGYYLMKDTSQEYIKLWTELSSDGHPSYSPDGSLVVTDTYPDRVRLATIYLLNECNIKKLVRVYSPFKYDNDVRCDLHPRWNRAGNRICFDSVFEGHRGIYVVNIDNNKNEDTQRYTEKHALLHNDSIPSIVKYSIITPNYNGFSLMKNYFASFEKQTYKDFELIIVDDQSTDDSYKKLRRYADASNMNIKVYRTEKNSGPGTARNIGMEKARGEWITFVDNDDWVKENLLEEIDKVISNNEVNCVVFDYYLKYDNKETIATSMYYGEEGIQQLSGCLIYTRNHSIGKFYRRNLCNQIRFPENLRRCEDVAFVCRAIETCGSIYYHHHPLYYYYQRQSSLSNNKKMDEADMVRAFSIVEESLGEKYPNEIAEKSITDLLYGGVLMMCKAEKSNRYIKEYIKNYEKRYPKWQKKSIIKHIGLVKRLYLKLIYFKQIHALKFITFLHSKLV